MSGPVKAPPPSFTRRWGQFLTGAIPQIHRIPGNRAILLADYAYQDPDGALHVARAGMVYDGGSIPRPLWGLSTNPWADDVLGPATIHDWYCQLGRDHGASPIPSDRAHYLFYLSLRSIDVAEWRARARWMSVRTLGPRFKGQVVSSIEFSAAVAAITRARG